MRAKLRRFARPRLIPQRRFPAFFNTASSSFADPPGRYDQRFHDLTVPATRCHLQ
jgi:hypothetical protein